MKQKPFYANKIKFASLGAALAVFFVIWMVLYPQEIYVAAKQGLETWWNIVLPALLPFFIASELLMGFGLVHFMGVLLQPVMRPLFNLPGAASLVMTIGFTSGFPIGSMVTAQLRREKLCTRLEGERLMAFTNNASPLFMLSAIAVGMFKSPQLGIIIALAHYGANLTMGFIFRFLHPHDPERFPDTVPRGNLLALAFQELAKAQERDGRPFGQILSDAVKKSMTNLLTIGGFVILFSVVIRIMGSLGILDLLAALFSLVLSPLGFHQEIFPALAKGFFEITLGSKAVTETAAPVIQKIMAINIILAWSGISVHAQVASMISNTDLRMGSYLLCRLGQGILSVFYTILLFHPENPLFSKLTIPAIQRLHQTMEVPSWLAQLEFYTWLLVIGVLGLILAGVLYQVFRSLRIILWRITH
ncbi:MAG: sporulation integral membrane protein YlbJ [Thermincolia bacterium]